MKHHTIKLRPDGRLEFLNPPPFPVAVQSRQRFSEIVPSNPLLCLAFRVLRWTFGEQGVMATWTWQWVCKHTCHILIGKYAGMFAYGTRQELLAWEREIWKDERHEPRVDL